jgi:hypothetical protein
VIFDGERKVLRYLASADDCYMSDIEGAEFPQPEKDNSVGYKKYGINNEGEQDDQAVGGVLIQEELQGGHNQPGKTYCLRERDDLSAWRKRWSRIDSKDRQQYRPDREDQSKHPEINLDGHDCVSFEFKQQSNAVSQKEARCSQTQVEQPKAYGKDLFPLINHALHECAL